MRSERALVTGMLVIPLVVVFVGWPAFAKWMVAPVADKPAPAPAVTPVAEAQANRSAPRPTDGAPATVAARPVGTKPAPVRMAEPTRVTGADSTQDGLGNSGAPIAPTTAPAVAAEAAQIDSTSDPSATVARFYDLVGQGHYGAAAELWSPHMRATYPPSENINQRFSQTQSMTVERSDLVSQDPQSGRAAVAVDVIESRPDGSRRWVGTWYLVRGPSGWLLDAPQFSGQ